MKTIFLLVCIQTFWAAVSFAQKLPLQNKGMIIQCTNLVIRWKAPTNPWPKTMWVYQIQLTKPSPTVLSNLMALGSFTEKDIDPKRTGSNGIAFSKNDHVLVITYPPGDINYNVITHYGPTNLAQDVPATNQLFQLTTNFLPKLGINLSELAKETNGLPKFHFPYDDFEYYVSNKTIVNIQRQRVGFIRTVDGLEYGGLDSGIAFGEHNAVVGAWLHWPQLKPVKLFEAATPEKIAQWIQEGRADCWPPNVVDEIDWSTIKSLTIMQAQARYAGEHSWGRQLEQSCFPSYVYPYAILRAIVDTGTKHVNIEIHCPVIDETKPLEIGP